MPGVWHERMPGPRHEISRQDLEQLGELGHGDGPNSAVRHSEQLEALGELPSPGRRGPRQAPAALGKERVGRLLVGDDPEPVAPDAEHGDPVWVQALGGAEVVVIPRPTPPHRAGGGGLACRSASGSAKPRIPRFPRPDGTPGLGQATCDRNIAGHWRVGGYRRGSMRRYAPGGRS